MPTGEDSGSTRSLEPPSGLRRRWVKKVGKQLLRGGFDRLLSHQSRIPDHPVLETALFPWAPKFQERWPEIRRELDRLLDHRDALPSFQDISPDQYRISPDAQWKTFVLYGFGERTALGDELCPRTMEALQQIPRLTTAFFSILAPGKHIPRHRGVTKGLVRCHLALKVPHERQRCVIEVDHVRCTWQEGELLFFDDTYPHEVWNQTPEERVVLFIDFERPLRLLGRWTLKGMLALMCRTAYVRDARRNQRAWEAQYRQLLSQEEI